MSSPRERTGARAGNDSDLCCDSAQTPNGPPEPPPQLQTRQTEIAVEKILGARSQTAGSQTARSQTASAKVGPVCVGHARREGFHRRARAVRSLDHGGLLTSPAALDNVAFGCRCERRQSPAARAGVACRRRPLPLNSCTLFAMTGARLQPRTGRAGVD